MFLVEKRANVCGVATLMAAGHLLSCANTSTVLKILILTPPLAQNFCSNVRSQALSGPHYFSQQAVYSTIRSQPVPHTDHDHAQTSYAQSDLYVYVTCAELACEFGLWNCCDIHIAHCARPRA